MITIYTQHPRSANPKHPAAVTLLRDGVEYVIATAPNVGAARGIVKGLQKSHASIAGSVVSENMERPFILFNAPTLPEFPVELPAAPVAESVSGHALSIEEINRLPVNQRFHYMEILTDLTINRIQPAMLVVGRGGTGKSFTIMQKIEQAVGKDAIVRGPYTERPLYNAFNGINDETYEVITQYYEAVVVIKGALSATQLFMILYNHRHNTIIFDDCDAVFDDENRANLLKAVLDSTDERVVTWASQFLQGQGWASTFEFLGQIIFISNKRMEKLPQPILSRATTVDLDMNEAELVERMREIGPKMIKDLTQAELDEVIDHLASNATRFKDFSLRTLIQACRFRKHVPAEWRELTVFAS